MTSLRFEVGADGVAILTMDVQDRPMNVATPSLRDELAAAVERVASDPSIRGAVLTSAKKDFMAGGDIKAMVSSFERFESARQVHRELCRPYTELLRRLETSGKPYAAAINGSALGAGLEMALACHRRFVADDARIVLALPEVSIGLMPGAGGSQRLPRLIGIQKALPLMLEGTRLSPEKALSLGVIDAVVAPAALLEAARAWIAGGADPVQPWDRKGYQVPGGAGYFNPEITRYYTALATRLSNSTHNDPAPVTLLDAVARGTAVPIDAGLRIESRGIARLLVSPVSRNLMRTNFLSKNDCEKLTDRPKDVPRRSFRHIGVVGAGLMGAGVAQVAADAGMNVVLIDASVERAQAARRRLEEAYARHVEKGRRTADEAAAALARIVTTTDYRLLSPAELVVEAVFESRPVKEAVFAQILAAVGPETVVASNTSSLPITGLAQGTGSAERFVGLHFFSPVDRMSLVEVIRGKQTSDRTLAAALDFTRELRKTPIVVHDAPGFFTTRVMTAYLFECAGMVGEGISPVLIDNAARHAGYAIGPLALFDELTLDLTYNAQRQYRQDAGPGWSEPYGFRVIEKLVELGRTGRKAGQGFYEYPQAGRAPWTGVREIYPPASPRPSVESLRTRMLYIQALEAARAYDDGVMPSAAHGDVGSVLGIGFPAYTGGVFSLIDTVGARAFVATCDALAARHGARWQASAGLRARAERNEAFHGAAA